MHMVSLLWLARQVVLRTCVTFQRALLLNPSLLMIFTFQSQTDWLHPTKWQHPPPALILQWVWSLMVIEVSVQDCFFPIESLVNDLVQKNLKNDWPKRQRAG